MTTRYLSCAETAKLIRVALKKAFPGVKFSVRSHTYSGGASIRVGWTDGPTTKMVEAVTNAYAGGGFDGMIDLKYSKYAWLMPDGSATFAETKGTASSMGMVESRSELQPSFRAEKVRFGSDYVFTDRKYSEEFGRRAFESACRRHGVNPAEFKLLHSSGFGPYIDRATDRRINGGSWDMSDLLHQELVRRCVHNPEQALAS